MHRHSMGFLFWGLVITIICLPGCMCEQKRHKIFWNTTNSLFQQSHRKPWNVHADDTIVFICPNDHKSRNQILWTYDENEYKDCHSGENTSPIFDCSNSQPGEGFELKVFTISMLPGNPVFEMKRPVYFFAQSNLCLAKNMKVEVLRIDPLKRVGEEIQERPNDRKPYNDDSGVVINSGYQENYSSRSSFEQYRYLIIMAVFAGVLLVGIHVVLCLAWLPRRLKRNLSNFKNPENGCALETNEHRDQSSATLFSAKTFISPGNNPDVNETLRNLAYHQIRSNDLYNQQQPQIQSTASLTGLSLQPTAIYSSATGADFFLPDLTGPQTTQAALLIQQNELQKQIQFQLAAQLAFQHQQQQQQKNLFHNVQPQSIYDVPKDSGNCLNPDSSYGTLNTPRSKKQKSSSISTNPHHTNRRKKT